jgi:predicted NBD/HSP70 family sugar kinase
MMAFRTPIALKYRKNRCRELFMKNSIDSSKRPHLERIKVNNQATILRLLRSKNSLSRFDLSEQSGLTQTAISRLVKDLIDRDICYEDKPYRAETKLGRKRVGLHLNPDAGYVVSACLSVFSRAVAISDVTGTKRYVVEIPEDVGSDIADTVRFIGSFVDETFKSEGLCRGRLLGAAIVVAGSIAPSTGHLLHAPLLNWHDFPIRSAVEEQLGCDVIVENIADALCLTSLDDEFVTSQIPKNRFLVHIAAGMGASLSIDGKIFRRRADESWIGNMPIPKVPTSNDPVETLNSTSSGRAVLKNANARIVNTLPFADCLNAVIERAESGETTARTAFYNAGYSLGLVLFSVTAAYLPDTIVLAGPTATTSFFEQGVREGYASQTDGIGIQTCLITTLSTSYIDASKTIALRKYFYFRSESESA